MEILTKIEEKNFFFSKTARRELTVIRRVNCEKNDIVFVNGHINISIVIGRLIVVIVCIEHHLMIIQFDVDNMQFIFGHIVSGWWNAVGRD